MPLAYCGTCAYCRRGLQHLCATMACVGLSHAWGGMAELATVAEYQVVRLPEGVTHRQGALIEPTAVAAYGVERAGVGPGDRVLVTGAGPIGALAALCARAAGASTVYISEPNPARRARAEALGVATVLDPTSVDVPEFLREQTDGLGVDVAIECSGHPSGFDDAIRSLRRRGHARADGPVRRRGVASSRCSGRSTTSRSSAPGATGSTTSIGSRRRSPRATCRSSASSRAASRLDGAPDAFAELASGTADEIKVLVDQ